MYHCMYTLIAVCFCWVNIYSKLVYTIMYIFYKENNNMYKAQLINNFLKGRIEKIIG